MARLVGTMREIAPGLWHWTARHPHLNSEVSSYYLEPERVLLDPMLPPEGIGWFDSHSTPEHVVLTNRHHDRDAWKLHERFGCEVHCIRNGLYELDGRGPVSAFDFGDELPGRIQVFEVDAICPDETGLHIPTHSALACADGVVRWPGEDGLSFVPDQLMDDPEETKRGLAASYRNLLQLDFDRLLLAHGDPVTAGAKHELERFVAAAGA
jgi:hypothetical protein